MTVCTNKSPKSVKGETWGWGLTHYFKVIHFNNFRANVQNYEIVRAFNYFVISRSEEDARI